MQSKQKYLWFLTLCYVMVLVQANWFVPRLIYIFGLTTDGGTLIFPFTFLFADLITEVYGYKYARKAIWIGFLFNIFFMAYGQLITHLPSPTYYTHNTAFDEIMLLNPYVIFGSMVSYLLAEPLNSYVLAKLKVKWHGKRLAFRFVLSTMIASGLDSLIFCSIAFYGLITNQQLIMLISTMWFIKIMIEIIGLPLSTWLANKLKQVEGIDRYDMQTNFNLFSLDDEYDVDSNFYKVL